jgi:hypothetical protein
MQYFSNYTGRVQALGKRYLLLGGGSVLVALILAGAIYVIDYTDLFSLQYSSGVINLPDLSTGEKQPEPSRPQALDKADYDKRMLALANIPAPVVTGTSTATSTVAHAPELWPADAVYPAAGALLPFHRIVAYYGNFYSTQMGVLGEYSTDVMLDKLRAEVSKWEKADPTTPVIPAIHYIAATAQASAGEDGDYSLRMPDDQIDHALALADQVDGIVFLDLQVGLADLQQEIHLLEPYLKMPQVNLGIDPEFSMKRGNRPGVAIGTVDASDINRAAEYLAKLVRENNLPPKVLIVHRFTQDMVTNYQDIKPLPEVQIVMDMDGWGSPAKKKNTYEQVIYSEPVQFTGFKVFYKNDLKAPSTGLMTPAEILDLEPRPIYIQYQ